MGTFNRRLWSSVLSFPLVMTGTQAVGAEDQQASPGNSSGPTGQGVALTEQELNNLESPIALYPDALVAQILAASTFPDQVTVADNWPQQNTSLTGSALMQVVNTQSWDRSVKALTQFPSVLNNMAQNLARTSQLGEAYHNQQSQVMSAIQSLRQQAEAAGNLKSTTHADSQYGEPRWAAEA